jgi:RNA polymerase sigma-70 factor (ECF subfamily)
MGRPLRVLSNAASNGDSGAVPPGSPEPSDSALRRRPVEPSAPHEADASAARVGAGAEDLAATLARAADGDIDAFRVLYERHRADVARLVARMLGSGRTDHDDVLQEVFLQVFRSLKDFRGQAKFSTWLHRVTVNVVLMQRRAARSRPVYAGELPPDVTVDDATQAPDEDAARRERMRAFGRLLDRLADKKRVVFILHELEGLSPAEIAKIVEAPVLTVRTRLFYARRELEAMLPEEPALASIGLSFTKHGSDEGETR